MDGDGNLYGTTSYGGADLSGVLFKLAPDGTETVLHDFGKYKGIPAGGLTADATGNFFFNIRDGEKVTPDPEGSELPDPVAANFEARIIARDIMIERLKAGRELDGQIIEIADDSGNVIQSIKVKEVVSPT